MYTVIPWEEYASTDFRGMLLQQHRSKKTGDLWGEIHEIQFEAHKLTIVLSWTTNEDPRKRNVEKTWQVEPVTIMPLATGPLYTDKSEFVFRDKAGCLYRIRATFTLKSPGRPKKPPKVVPNNIQPPRRRNRPRYRPEFFTKND